MVRGSKELLEVEDLLVDVLTAHLGWTEIDCTKADDLRHSLKEPVLTVVLKKKIRELNGWISEENANRVVRSITDVQAASVLEANERIHAMLERGTTVRQDRGDGLGLKSHDVMLVDYDRFEKNDFNVVRQFRVRHYRECRLDVVLFVNGLPVVVVECKSPVERDALQKGRLQLFRYQESQDEFRNVGCPKLFNTVQVVASTSGHDLEYATNFTDERHWSEWKESYEFTLDGSKNEFTLDGSKKNLGRNPSSQDVFLFGVCKKERLLDVIQNYVVYERESGRLVKKLCKYQQFRAVSKLIRRVEKLKTTKGGVVWHTQGSGKSLSMLWTAVKLRRVKKFANPTIVVVTDRTDLDDQITGTFRRCGFPNPVQTKSVKHLQECLSDPVGQTIMTTIQKFQDVSEEYPTLSNDPNVFVLVDEAHRTHYSTLAANMRKAIPFATFIGFTGTPISKKYRNTREIFGEDIDVYDHNQAIDDRATVEIFYEGRMPELFVEGDSIDEVFDRVFSEYSEEDKERMKRKYANQEAIGEAKERIKKICLDLVKHFEKFIRPNGFKAQIVASSRRAAVKYKKALDELNAPGSEVLISKNHNDGLEFSGYHKSKAEEREVIRRFKEEKEPEIMIVCDKLLTGFDAPVEQVMYLDSPLKEHTLLQAIARVNRTCSNKNCGFVIDYRGISLDIRDALDMFSLERRQGVINTDYKNEIIPKLQTAHNAAMNFFRDAGGDAEKCVRVLEPENERVMFDIRFKRFAKYMDVLMPDPKALPFLKDLKWLGEIRIRAKNRYRDEQLSLQECSPKIRRIIDEYVRAGGVTQLVEPMSIFSEKFDDELEKLTSVEAKASEMEHALKHELSFKVREDPVYYESLRERLDKIIQDLKEGRIDHAKQLMLFMEIMEDVRRPEKQAERSGVQPDVVPFYNVLAEYGSKEDMKEVSQQIYDGLEDLAVVEWRMKEDVKREMRRRVKRILRAAGYRKDKVESTAASLLDLAGARFDK